MVIHASFLHGQFGNDVGREQPDRLNVDILSKFQRIQMLLLHFHSLFYTKVSYHLTVVGFVGSRVDPGYTPRAYQQALAIGPFRNTCEAGVVSPEAAKRGVV